MWLWMALFMIVVGTGTVLMALNTALIMLGMVSALIGITVMALGAGEGVYDEH